MTQKRKNMLTAILITAVSLLLLLGILYLIFDNYILSVVLRSYMRFLLTGGIAFSVYTAFYKQLEPGKIRNTMTICTTIMFLDLCVLDTIRYALSGGVSTVLFLPACLPLCFMVIMHASKPGDGAEKKDLLKLAYWVGIPLLVLSVYFEVLSFLHI